MGLGAWERRWEGGTSSGSPAGALAILTPGPEGLEGEHRVPFLGGLGLVRKRCWDWLAMSALASAEQYRTRGQMVAVRVETKSWAAPITGHFLGARCWVWYPVRPSVTLPGSPRYPQLGVQKGGWRPLAQSQACAVGQVAEQLVLWHLWGGRVPVPGPLCSGSPSPSLTASPEGS